MNPENESTPEPESTPAPEPEPEITVKVHDSGSHDGLLELQQAQLNTLGDALKMQGTLLDEMRLHHNRADEAATRLESLEEQLTTTLDELRGVIADVKIRATTSSDPVIETKAPKSGRFSRVGF